MMSNNDELEITQMEKNLVFIFTNYFFEKRNLKHDKK